MSRDEESRATGGVAIGIEKGGSAARDPRRGGIWRRFLDWVAPTVPPASPAEKTDPTGPVTLRLHLPDGTLVTIKGHPLESSTPEHYELAVAPPPENEPELLEVLRQVGDPGEATPFVDRPAPELEAVGSPELPPEKPAASQAPAQPEEEERPPLTPALQAVVRDYLMEDLFTEPVSTVRRGGAALAYSEGEEGRAPEAKDASRKRESIPTPKLSKAASPPRGSPAAGAPAEKPPERARTPTPAPAVLKREAPIVGIDFGTTYSSIAVYTGGRMTVIPDELGAVQVPSVVSFPTSGEVLVGKEARERLAGDAQWTIASVKRLLGRPYKDPQVASLVGRVAFRTFAGTDKFTRFEAHGKIYSTTDLSAMILRKLWKNASQFLGVDVSRAVFTVPVGHGTLQRSALELAARQAGFDVVAMLTEPSASALTHGFRSERTSCAVYDFGGGTFDFCLLEIDETAFRVLCAGGDSWLGGDDFDTALANHLADQFWKETEVDLRSRTVEWQSLVFACEQAKRKLSRLPHADIRIDDLLHTASGMKGLRAQVTQKEFSEIVAPLVHKSISLAEGVLGQAGIPPDRVENVILSGGTTLIPSVQEAVRAAFGKKPILSDPELSVVKGAALRAAELGGEPIGTTSMASRTLREAAGRTIGAGQKGGEVVILIQRDDPLPVEASHVFHTLADQQTEMVIVLYEESTASVDQIRSIGQLRYKGLKPAPAGSSFVDFAFLLDEEGLLHATATVEGKKISQTIQLEK